MKKVLAIICALALCMGCFGAFAEDMRAQLPEVTLKVKEALGISDAYTDFSSSNYNGIWELHWTGDKGEISVTCDSAGKIYNYYVYEYDYKYDGDYAPRYPSISAEELKAIADGFLGRVIVDADEGWVIDEIDSTLQHGSEARVNVDGRLTIKGVPADAVINLSIDAGSGEVTSFYRSDGHMKYVEFEGDMTEGISAEAALELLRSSMGLELVYYITDSDEMAKLVFMPTDNSKYVVRASDGELINLDEAFSGYYGYQYASDTVASMGAADNGELKQLTDAELAGISVYDDALSVEELDALLRAMPELGLADGFAITDASYYESGDRLMARIGYIRQLAAEEAEARGCDSESVYYDTRDITIDAVGGQLMSIYSYYPGIRTAEIEIDNEALEAKANDFIAKYFADRTGQLQLDETTENISEYGWDRSVYYNYVRTHNGYPYRGNSVSINVNAETGVIDYLDVNWNDGLEFAEVSAEEIISAEAAMEAYIARFDFENVFVSLPEGMVDQWEMLYKLEYCWHMYDRENIYAVDAVTGEALKRTDDSAGFAYEDIEGHAHAGAIGMLGQYGVGFSGGQFRPDDGFTARDALVMISQAAQYTYGENIEARDFAALVELAEELGAPEPEGYAEDQVLTRGEFAGILICMSGYEKAAALTGIYDCGFADNDSIADEDYGRIAIAYGMGLIDVDENGNINAASELTRGEGAAIFHNLLSVK